jgi:hypothetical protein
MTTVSSPTTVIRKELEPLDAKTDPTNQIKLCWSNLREKKRIESKERIEKKIKLLFIH